MSYKISKENLPVEPKQYKSIKVPYDVWKSLKIKALTEDTTISAIIEKCAKSK